MGNLRANQTVLENVRLSYVHLTKPYANQPGQEEKYSVTILLKKSDTKQKAKLDAVIANATAQGKEKRWNGVVPPVVPVPVHDGDGVRQDGNSFGPECKGCWVMTASCKAEQKPQVVDGNLNLILDGSQIYSGMYANVMITAYPYAFAGKKGIGFGLGPVQKTGDGDSLGGSAPTAADVFGVIGGVDQAAQKPKINPLTGEPM
jgi:hypothetical protein